jgi:hypothetical protein
MNPSNCYIIVYNNQDILFARKFTQFISKYDNSTFWAAKSSKCGIHIPKNVEYFSLIYLSLDNNPLDLLSKGQILLASDFPELNTKNKYFIQFLNKSLNINVKNKFFSATISNFIPKEFQS